MLAKKSEGVFYKIGATKKENNEFMYGFHMARDKIIESRGGLNKAHKKALSLSEKDFDTLSLGERGYMTNVVNNLFSKKGKALSAAEIYSNTNTLSGDLKKDVGKRLIDDASASRSLKYMKDIEGFMKENKMMRLGAINSLELAVHEAGRKTGAFKKISPISIALVVAGFIFSSYNITGNVISDIPSSGKIVGILLFVVGLIWMTISLKEETAKIN